MTNKKQHISKEDFQRYLENQMTDAERNAFERELQKHPFEAEALEGMQEISPEEFKTDLHELKSKINADKRKTKTRYWAAAATFLLLVSTGILWFQLKDKSPVPELTDNKTIQKQEEAAPSPKGTGEKKQAREIAVVPPKLKAKKSATIEKRAEKEITPDIKTNPSKTESLAVNNTINQKITRQDLENDTELNTAPQNKQGVVILGANRFTSTPKTPNLEFSTATLSTDSSEKIIEGKIISLADSLPLPGTIVIEKGTQNGVVTDVNGNFVLKLTGKNDSLLTASFVGMQTKNFHPSPDSMNVIGLEPVQMALDEVAVIGYGSYNQKKTLTGSVSRVTKVKNTPIQPVNGMEAYKKYLDENAILPDNYKRKREVVKLLIHFDETGDITQTENKNQADSVVFEKAIKMVKNGPEWKPEIRDGEPVKSQTELRIVFQKND